MEDTFRVAQLTSLVQEIEIKLDTVQHRSLRLGVALGWMRSALGMLLGFLGACSVWTLGTRHNPMLRLQVCRAPIEAQPRAICRGGLVWSTMNGYSYQQLRPMRTFTKDSISFLFPYICTTRQYSQGTISIFELSFVSNP